MEIVGVEINGIRFLPYSKENNSTGYYRSFMCYCINNYFVQIIMTPELNRRFSLAINDPIFKAAIKYNRVEGYNGMYYSTHYGNEAKKRIMCDIARLLRIELFVHTLE